MNKRIILICFFIFVHIPILSFSFFNVKSTLNSLIGNYPLHFISFFGLSFILSLILINKEHKIKYPFTICFLYSIFIAIFREMLQQTLTNIGVSYVDILVAVAGAGSYSIIGIIAYETKLFEKYWIKQIKLKNS